MKPTTQPILTIKGGSSSVKFALFGAGGSLQRILEGIVERIGQPEAVLRVKGAKSADNFRGQWRRRNIGRRWADVLFCYRVKKWIGAFAASLGGVDQFAFAGGIGKTRP